MCICVCAYIDTSTYARVRFSECGVYGGSPQNAHAKACLACRRFPSSRRRASRAEGLPPREGLPRGRVRAMEALMLFVKARLDIFSLNVRNCAEESSDEYKKHSAQVCASICLQLKNVRSLDSVGAADILRQVDSAINCATDFAMVRNVVNAKLEDSNTTGMNKNYGLDDLLLDPEFLFLLKT